MTLADKLKRDLSAIRESIELVRTDLAGIGLSPDEKLAIRAHIAACEGELAAMRGHLERPGTDVPRT